MSAWSVVFRSLKGRSAILTGNEHIYRNTDQNNSIPFFNIDYRYSNIDIQISIFNYFDAICFVCITALMAIPKRIWIGNHICLCTWYELSIFVSYCFGKRSFWGHLFRTYILDDTRDPRNMNVPQCAPGASTNLTRRYRGVFGFQSILYGRKSTFY